MAFVVETSGSYLYKVKFTTFSEDGRPQLQTFSLRYKRLMQDKVDEYVKRGKEMADSGKTEIDDVIEYLSDIVVGWEGVQDADGEALPFNKENFSKLVNFPMMSTTIFDNWMESVQGGKKKN